MSDSTGVIEKIRKLLALAAGAGSAAEAETAMAHAQRLMAEHNLAVADIDAAESAAAGYVTEEAGGGSRKPPEASDVAAIVDRFFFVRVVFVAGRPWRAELFGSPENVAMGRYVWAYLVRTYRRLWRQHSGDSVALGNRRASFYSGITAALSVKLKRAADSRPAGDAGALVRVDSALSRAFDEQYGDLPHHRSRKVVATFGDLAAGFRAGQSIEVRRPLPAPQQQGRLPG